MESNGITICDILYNNYEELEKAFVESLIHPGDLKNTCAEFIEKMIAPVREAMNADVDLIKKAYSNKK